MEGLKRRVVESPELEWSVRSNFLRKLEDLLEALSSHAAIHTSVLVHTSCSHPLVNPSLTLVCLHLFMQAESQIQLG